MWERLSSHPGELGVIILTFIFIILFFILQVIVPLVLLTRRKLTKVSYNGQEMIDLLLATEHYDEIKVNEIKKSFSSPYYKYDKYNKTLNLSTKTLEGFNLDTVFKVFSAMVFTNEKRHKIFNFSWQLWVLTGLSVLPYLCGLSMVLLIFIPDASVFANTAGMKYYLSAEALGIVAFIVILIIGIWWTFALQQIELEFETYLKQFNNKAFEATVMHHFKVCSYVPFSWRLIL